MINLNRGVFLAFGCVVVDQASVMFDPVVPPELVQWDCLAKSRYSKEASIRQEGCENIIEAVTLLEAVMDVRRCDIQAIPRTARSVSDSVYLFILGAGKSLLLTYNHDLPSRSKQGRQIGYLLLLEE